VDDRRRVDGATAVRAHQRPVARVAVLEGGTVRVDLASAEVVATHALAAEARVPARAGVSIVTGRPIVRRERLALPSGRAPRDAARSEVREDGTVLVRRTDRVSVRPVAGVGPHVRSDVGGGPIRTGVQVPSRTGVQGQRILLEEPQLGAAGRIRAADQG